MAQNVFDTLKRSAVEIVRQPAPDSVCFGLYFDQAGAYLTVIDRQGTPISPDYKYYSGATREILKAIERVQEKNSFLIDWEKPANRIYLADHADLLDHLQQGVQVLDQTLAPVPFAGGEARVSMRMTSRKTRMKSALVLNYQGQEFTGVRLVTEHYALAGGTLYPIPSLGKNPHLLHTFESDFQADNLEKYLSLLSSHFDRIQVRYERYKPVEGPPQHTKPTLIFEKVDGNNALYLHIATSLPGFEADFFTEYDVTKIVTLNELEQTMQICAVIHTDLYDCFTTIENQLKRYKRTLSSDSGYHLEGSLFIIEEALAREFIYKDLTTLMTRFVVYGAEKLKSYKVRAVTPTLQLSLAHNIDFLEGEATLDIDGHTIPLFEALNAYRKHAYIPLNDGTHGIINPIYIQKLTRLFTKHQGKARVSFFDLPIVEELLQQNAAQKAFAQSREIFLGFNTLQKTRVTYPALRATLRKYQKQGYKWLAYLHKHGLGGCLADDMGLGKTLQAIAMLATVYPEEQKSSLIIMPRSLLFNWAKELDKFCPDLTYYTYHGANRDFEAARTHQVILTTYATVRNAIQELKEETFHYVILDESQHIKNLHSQTSKAVRLLRAQHRLALSGTPIENNLGELYALFRFLNPAMFGSQDDFSTYYALPIQRHNDKTALHELKTKIYPFILRRLKKDVVKELPEKIEQTLFVEMSPKQHSFYEQRRAFYYNAIKNQIAESGIKKSQMFILQALNELRQIASIPEAKSDNAIVSPKRELLREQMQDIVANEHKVLVFANYLYVLDCVAGDLDQLDIPYVMMTGATRDRERLVEQFQHDDQYKAFLMTLKTGGVGLNLTAADHIFIFDPWWNKAAENQAIDRTHRIGQDKTVFSYKLITRGTIEEKILQLQAMKNELFESLISHDSASIKALGEEDVDFILGA